MIDFIARRPNSAVFVNFTEELAAQLLDPTNPHYIPRDNQRVIHIIVYDARLVDKESLRSLIRMADEDHKVIIHPANWAAYYEIRMWWFCDNPKRHYFGIQRDVMRSGMMFCNQSVDYYFFHDHISMSYMYNGKRQDESFWEKDAY